MKSKFIAVIYLMCCAYFCNAQTKIIAFKSHSGSAASFAAEFHGHFELLICNLGESRVFPSNSQTNILVPPGNLLEIQVLSSKNKRLDSVICVNDSLVIFVTAELKKGMISGKNKWIEGRDTIIGNSNLNGNNIISHVRGYIKSTFFFQNDIKYVKFKGYSTNNQNFVPVLPYIKPTGGNQPFVILILSLILLLAGFFSWRSYKTFQPW
jgi:hypothetical protein